ncbi:nicotinamide n-methyltransferase [Ceratobasidium sp. 414]|nr:nicotinamide n-methyltransferase [Ceratobasidium sp. 414]
MSAEEDLNLGDLFEEPPRPPTPPPTFATYHRKPQGSSQPPTSEWTSVDLQLVGHHVLWAQHLWNAAIVLADFLDARSTELCEDKSVLELGAGGALPSLVTALCGARQVRPSDARGYRGFTTIRQVVITDYPDAPLIDNITRNIDRNIREDMRRTIKVEGYVWGTDPRKLFGPTDSGSGEDGARMKVGFDMIILSDLIFNHSQHAALLDTCEAAIRRPTRPSSHMEQPPGMTVLSVFEWNPLKQLMGAFKTQGTQGRTTPFPSMYL